MFTVYLPENVRFYDVMRVVAKLLGNVGKFNPERNCYKVQGIKIHKEEGVASPEIVTFTIERECECKHKGWHVFPVATFYYHFETNEGTGRQLALSTYHSSWLPTKASVAKILAKKICDFFGGKVYFAENDKPDYTVPFKNNVDNWIERTERIHALKPIVAKI